MAIISKRINNKEKDNVQNAISYLNSAKSRKRAYISLLALNILINYLRERRITVSTVNNCWNNPLILNEFDIADIKLENNLRIDVRAIVGDKYPQMWIPKDHRAYELSPDIYVAIKVNNKLDRAELIGFIEAKDITAASGNKNYFFIDSNILRPILDLLAAIKTIAPKHYIYLSLDHNYAKDLFLSYLDNTISGLNKEFLIKHLATCESCREEFYTLYDLNRAISCVKKEELLYYFTLKDYENALPQMSDSLQSSQPKNHKIQKPGLFNSIKNISKKENKIKPQYIGLSSIANPEDSEQIFPDPAIIESPGIKDALDMLFNPSQDNQFADDNYENQDNNEEEILEELENGSQQNEPEVAPQEHQENVEETQEHNIEQHYEAEVSCESVAESSQEYQQTEVFVHQENCLEDKEIVFENPKTIVRKFARCFRQINRLVSINQDNFVEPELQLEESDEVFFELPVIELNEVQEDAFNEIFSEANLEEKLEINNEEKVFKNLANKMQTQDSKLVIKESPFDETSSESVTLETPLEQSVLFEYQYKLLKEQSKFDILEQTQTNELIQETAKIDENIEDILASIDDIEIIDSLEAVKTEANKSDITRHQSQQQDEQKNNEEMQKKDNLVDIRKFNKTAQLIKVASVLTAAGVLTCTGLVIGNQLALNDKLAGIALAQKPQTANEIENISQQAQFVGNQRNLSNIPETNTPNLKEHLASITGQEYSAQVQPTTRNINDILANAFVSQGQQVKISNISWEIGLSLANDPILKNYLMVTGQIMKMALSRELLSATESITNNQIKVQVVMDLQGIVQESKIQTSSGSRQVDEIVLQTIKETFNYTKLPTIQTNKRKISAGIIINL
ncbi:MAG: hypothetical protein A2287_08735 [Candidatus Melainabacteria bacterium RIFOXYA12_FULL_32_12]|nr:MAG: hypothetical protein A2255_01440 [Candidatus Melainabacteria bacterium RIFOXYA2_FULL_32_9]OGI30465.1 MAG: hypothetical protein A2287_08735 [Candidatus Melainabacteria bacterium RIFOXYA12_FULL_32_12]